MRSWRAVAAVALILACASMLFTVVLSARTHSNAERARRDLAVQTRSTILSSCERGNTLRRTIQGLILNGIPTTRQYVHEGTLSPQQGRRAERQARTAARRIAPVVCARAYPKLP
jgi:hypothetical protein